MKKRLSVIIYSLIFVVVDQLSKYFFFNLKIGADSQFLEPAFNTGISRSLPINMIIIIILSVIIATFIIILHKRNIIGKRATICLLAGTVGNLIDRIYLGGVRDFILVFKRFPIFNIADILICSGTTLIIIKELFTKKNKS